MKILLLLALVLISANASVLPLMEPSILDGKIVGGYPVNIGDAPYTVSLLRDYYNQGYYGHTCGGAIINQNVIVTAAHCTNNSKIAQWKVRAGSTYHNAGGQVVPILRYVQHPEFNRWLGNDISLIFLATPLVLGPNVSTILLPFQGQTVEDGAFAITSGWGLLADGGKQPKNLYQVSLPIVNQQICARAYHDYSFVSKDMICAGKLGVGGQDACQGDSGGPLVIDEVLVGVTSWGRGCAQPKFPGVWTRVASYANWIQEQIASDSN